jgi:hypothetical protein
MDWRVDYNYEQLIQTNDTRLFLWHHDTTVHTSMRAFNTFVTSSSVSM